MLAFRSVTTGLLGACLYLITDLAIRVQPADHEDVELARATDPSAYAAPPRPTSRVSSTGSGVMVIDVAPGVPTATIVELVKVGEEERIVAIGDRFLSSNLVAGAEIAAEITRGGRFLDLTIMGRGTARRVIVALHEQR